jgi:hypothetical protein
LSLKIIHLFDKIKNKILNLIVSILYSISFIWGFIVWIYPNWEYLGYSYNEAYTYDYSYLSIIVIICSVPTLWMPTLLSRPSMIVYWMLYLMTFIPMIIGVSLSDHFNFNEIFKFDFFVLISFFITGLGYYIKLYNFKPSLLHRKIFWRYFFLITILFLGYTVFIFRNSLTFVGIFASDLYDFRFNGRDIEIQYPLVGYIILWLSGAFFPFILAIGIVDKKKIMILISIFGQVILYMTMANKAFILSIFFMWMIYYFMKKTKNAGATLGIFLCFLTFLFTFSQEYFIDDLKLMFFPFTSLFLIRTIGVSSLTSNLYYHFFKTHPHTYYSHVSILNKFIPYPYKNEMIGVVIGEHYTSISRFNVNANMYITDGLVAIGLGGMPIVGMACCIIFYFIDSVSKNHNILFTSLLLSYAGLNMMNVSLFTSVISGGLFFTVIFLFFFNPIKNLS